MPHTNRDGPAGVGAAPEPVRAGKLNGPELTTVDSRLQELGIAVVVLDLIVDDDTAQMRVVGTDPATVNEYAEAMEAGASFPPVVLFHDGDNYWPGDGFHRIAATRRIDRSTISADVRQGSKRDAILFAAGANADHGLRRTQADKRNAVETLLKDPDWAKLSDRKIGEYAKVDHKTVGRVRRELTGEFPTARPRPAEPGNSPRRDEATGTSMVEKMVRSLSDDVLVAECRRRGWEVSK